MTAAIAHRGPDDDGFYFSPDGRLALGFRRLSIIDLAGGHQPMSNEDRSAWIVFNGEIYNHADLRPGLESRGHAYATRTDTETILHQYEEDGDDVVTKLTGHVRPGPLRRPEAAALPGPRPDRHQAALLVRRRADLRLRLRDQGADRAPGRAAPPESPEARGVPGSPGGGAAAHALRGHPQTAGRPQPGGGTRPGGPAGPPLVESAAGGRRAAHHRSGRGRRGSCARDWNRRSGAG